MKCVKFFLEVWLEGLKLDVCSLMWLRVFDSTIEVSPNAISWHILSPLTMLWMLILRSRRVVLSPSSKFSMISVQGWRRSKTLEQGFEVPQNLVYVVSGITSYEKLWWIFYGVILLVRSARRLAGLPQIVLGVGWDKCSYELVLTHHRFIVRPEPFRSLNDYAVPLEDISRQASGYLKAIPFVTVEGSALRLLEWRD